MKKWTEEDVEMLKANYHKGFDECARLLGRSYLSVKIHAPRIGLRQRTPRFNWDNDALKKLSILWASGSDAEVRRAFPGVGMHAIQEMARKNGFKRDVVTMRKGDLTPLLEESREAYYWAGFIAADGHISKTGQLVVQIHKRDQDHLERLAKFLKTTVKIPYKDKPMVRIAVADKRVGLEFAEKFRLASNKTVNPPDEKLPGHWGAALSKAFMAGFIDGDGSATKAGAFAIEIHGSWINFLARLMAECKLGGDPKITKRGYASAYIPFNTEFCESVLGKGMTLPLMSRKWKHAIHKLRKGEIND